MIRINPDPHTGGYAYVPVRAVTAFFPSGKSSRPALQALFNAGFAEDRVEVFSGAKGAELLDAEGRRHGFWVRFMRSCEESLTEDYDEFIKADEILRSGGTVVAVYTLDDEEKKCKAVEILMANHGEDVMYWGPWMRQSFSLGSTPVPRACATPEEFRPQLELDLRMEQEGADNYRRQADEAAGLGLMGLKARLEQLAADRSRHAREIQQMLKGL